MIPRLIIGLIGIIFTFAMYCCFKISARSDWSDERLELIHNCKSINSMTLVDIMNLCNIYKLSVIINDGLLIGFTPIEKEI